MDHLVPLLLVAFLSSANALYPNVIANNTPQQIHISYGKLPFHMMVTWNTIDQVTRPTVQYGLQPNHLNRSVAAVSQEFVDGGDERRSQFIHRGLLQDLVAGQRYWYRVGSTSGPYSEVFSFVAMRTDPSWSPHLAVYGDLGLKNPQSLPRLLRDVKRNMYDAIIHVGDYGYDMATNNALVGDAFMRLIQPVAANVPYMTCPGNHEHHYNFTNYKARFSMPDKFESMFYSFDMGPVHFVSISTEFYYFIYYGIAQVKTQFQWLENDLKVANQPENRAKRPWIIMFGHRPMYCTNNDGDCGFMTEILRNGVPLVHWFGVEPLLARYGVDLAIWAHEHSYERMWPVLAGQIRNGTSPGQPYLDPLAPVHVVTGSAGCEERHDTFGPDKPFSAFRSDDYGYSRMHIINATHLTFEQLSDDQGGKIIDKFMLVRHKHTPFHMNGTSFRWW